MINNSNILISTREAYGKALTKLAQDNENIVALDAEVSNSTYSEIFKKSYPKRFFEMFIAEQNMVAVALGISKLNLIPFISTFSAFLSRAYDQIRMSQYSNPNIKLVGSHAGVSIGEDGPSQMGLEDISMMRSILNSVVFYPSDEISTFKLVELMAKNNGLFYLRTTREKTPLIYSENAVFEIGGINIIKESEKDSICLFTSGITLHEALKAYDVLTKENIFVTVADLYCIKPIDKEKLKKTASKTKKIIVVEDHYPYGGIGEAVKSLLIDENIKFKHLCIEKIPKSGKPEELRAYEHIDYKAIVDNVKNMI